MLLECSTYAHRFTVCCIYHKPKEFDESSSSDSSSDSDSDPDSDDDDRARRLCNHDHDHDHDHGEHADGSHGTASRDPPVGGVVHELNSDLDDTNVYERTPRKKPKQGKPPHNGCEWLPITSMP